VRKKRFSEGTKRKVGFTVKWEPVRKRRGGGTGRYSEGCQLVKKFARDGADEGLRGKEQGKASNSKIIKKGGPPEGGLNPLAEMEKMQLLCYSKRGAVRRGGDFFLPKRDRGRKKSN